MLKRAFKRNSHNIVFKALAGLGRSINRLYENRNHDIESNGELTVLKKLAKFSPEVIIDGGANNGDYSLWSEKICKGSRIYAFEPVEETFEVLLKNIKGAENIIPIKKGLFSENCTRKINVFNSTAHSSIYDVQGLSYDAVKTVDIDLVSGDHFLEENKIQQVDLLKLDLEGAEYDALIGFGNYIKTGKIKMIQFEYGYINITTKKLLIDFYNFFEANNYIIGKIFPKNVAFRKYEFKYEDFIGPNFIAVHKSEHELIKALEKK